MKKRDSYKIIFLFMLALCFLSACSSRCQVDPISAAEAAPSIEEKIKDPRNELTENKKILEKSKIDFLRIAPAVMASGSKKGFNKQSVKNRDFLKKGTFNRNRHRIASGKKFEGTVLSMYDADMNPPAKATAVLCGRY